VLTLGEQALQTLHPVGYTPKESPLAVLAPRTTKEQPAAEEAWTIENAIGWNNETEAPRALVLTASNLPNAHGEYDARIIGGQGQTDENKFVWAQAQIARINERLAELRSNPSRKGTLSAFEKAERGIRAADTKKLLAQRKALEEFLARLKPTRQPETKPAVEPVQPERRKDLERRKRVSEMTQEEKDRELLTDPLSQIKNRRAWDEVEQDWNTLETKPHVAYIDADGLGYVNDTFGHGAGDAHIRAVADALRAAGLGDASYRYGGDEIIALHPDAAELRARTDAARKILEETVVSYVGEDGKTHSYTGVSWSAGFGESKGEADAGLKVAKRARAESGLRAPEKGGRPPGLVELGEEGRTPAEEAEAPVQAAEPGSDRGDTEGARVEVAPKVEGVDTTFKAGDEEHSARWAVYDIRDVATSHTDELNENPAYPSALQPRDRSRQASREQIAEMAQKLDPRLMGENPLAQHGAPIVGEDGAVESGNARTIALRSAYEQGLPSAKRYREWLAKNGGSLGINRADVEGVERPVLVRVRTSELTPEQRVQFTRTANARETAAMGAAEQAKADAERLTPATMSRFDVGESGDIGAASNRDFVRQFIGALPTAEQGAMRTADGAVSQEGMRRIRNAVFFHAYGDAEALTRLAESVDDPARNITNGMLRAAGMMVDLRARIEAETVYPVDIAEDVATAAGKLATLREQGESVTGYLAQIGMFGEDLTPLQRSILVHLEQNRRSAKRIAATLADYADLAVKAGDPSSGILFEDIAPPEKATLWQAAINRNERMAQDEPGLFTEAGTAEAQPATAEAPRPAVGGAAGTKAPARPRATKAGAKAEASAETVAPKPHAKRTPEAGQKSGEVRRSLPEEQQRTGPPPEDNLPRVIPQPGAGGEPPANPPTAPRKFGEYSDPATNALIQDNRSVSQAPEAVHRVTDMLGRLGRIATREFEHIPNDPALYEFRDLIRHVARAGKVIAQDEAVIKMARALDKLSPEETQVLGDHFFLHGMAEDIQTQRAAHLERAVSGKRTWSAGPFEPLLPLDPKTGEAWTEQRLQQALEENDADVEGNEAVQQAIARAREMNDSVWDAYWNLGEDVLGRERPEKKQTYFRHKMIAYQAAARLANSGALGPRAQRVIRSATNFSFLKRRVGSNLLYDTDWITTQMDWMPQMLLGTKKLALLKHVQDKMDITRDLHLEALDINDDLFVPYLQSLQRVFGREVEKENEQAAWRERQAAVVKLARLASEGVLPDAPSGKFAVLLTHLAANHQLNVDREANSFTQRIDVPPVALDQVPEYVEWLRGSGTHRNVIPRHNAKSRAARLKQAGKERVEPADLIPDGYVEWRGAPGTILSDAATMPEQLQAAIVQAVAEQVGLPAVELEHLQKRVSWRRPLIIRVEAARTLDNILERDPDSPEAFISRLLQYGLGQWKATKITWLPRAISYYLHNGVGDLTNFVRATGGDPRAFQRYVVSSNKMLRTLFRGQVPDPIVELYFQQGASVNIQTSAEGIGTETGIDILGKYTRRRVSWAAGQYIAFKNRLRNPHDLREHTLRLALFRYYYDHLQEHGVPPNYGASDAREIEALTSNARKAWNLSNDAMVSYDRTTEGGRLLAKYVYPFWRWKEGNARAQVGFARNALGGADARLMAATGRKMAGKALPFVWSLQLARAGLLAANGLIWAYTWNKMLGGQKVREADDKMPDDIRHRPHFTFIDPVTGRTLTFDRFDPMTDFASNFAIDNIGGYLESINKGWMAPAELPAAMARDASSTFLNSLGPQWQFLTRTSGLSLFPNAFEPRPVVDQMETLFDELSLGAAWRSYLGRPQKRSTWAKMLLGANVVDVNEGAYYEMRGRADDWMQKAGKPRDKGGSAEPTELSSSAYWFRQARRYGDTLSAAVNLLAYQAAGGDDKKMINSLKKMEPLSGMPPSERTKLLAGLQPDDAERMRMAYYHWASMVAPDFDVSRIQARDISDFVQQMRANLSGIGGSPGAIDAYAHGLMEQQRRAHPELEQVRTKQMEREIMERVMRRAGG
jgi:diguanylate cyclase (GGDEF)-like protein